MANSESKASGLSLNLLLVDDQPSNLLALEAVLSDRGYNLILARSGSEALALLNEHEIAVILLDIQMPEMDGFETARRIKSIHEYQNIPIIFITAIYKEDPWIKKGYEAGGIDYFCKPFDPDILRMKVALYTSFHEKLHLLQEREKRIKETDELLKTERKLSDVLETLPVGVLIADAEGRIYQVNEQALRIWGAMGQSEKSSYGDFLDWWNHDDNLIKASHGPMARSLHGETSHNELTHIRCLDGSSRYVLTSASPLRTLGGQVEGVVMVIQDMTKHKQIELDMEQRIQKLISAEMAHTQAAQD